jgi:transposase
MLDALPQAKILLGVRGYDADWLRQALNDRGIEPCFPSKTKSKVPIPHDHTLYRHRIENMFGKLKDWRRIHPSAAFQRCFASSEPFGCSARYDRYAHTFSLCSIIRLAPLPSTFKRAGSSCVPASDELRLSNVLY